LFEAASGRPHLVDSNASIRDCAAMTPSACSLITVGSLGRLVYGLASMFAPRFMSGRYAPAEPESFMSLRGFGGQYMAIAVFTLFAAQSPQLVRPALFLNVGVDVCDAMAGAFELREKGWKDPIACGGVALPAINLATWLSALRLLER
jgi:hypothetical protein